MASLMLVDGRPCESITWDHEVFQKLVLIALEDFIKSRQIWSQKWWWMTIEKEPSDESIKTAIQPEFVYMFIPQDTERRLALDTAAFDFTVHCEIRSRNFGVEVGDINPYNHF